MKKNFESRVIAVQSEKVLTELRANKEAAKLINREFEKLDTFLEEEPTNKSRRELISKGYLFVQERLKRNLPFPNAPLQDNYRLMGKDPAPFKKIIAQLITDFRNNNLIIDGTVVKTDFDQASVLTEKYTIYTENELENEVLDLAERLVVFLNENSSGISKFTRIYPGPTDEGRVGISNVSEILQVVDSDKNESEFSYTYTLYPDGIKRAAHKVKHGLRL